MNAAKDMYRPSLYGYASCLLFKGFISGLGKLSLQYILQVHKVKFYYHLLCVGNSLLTDLFWLYVNDCYFKADCLHHIANHKRIAMYEQFYGDCQWTTVLGVDNVYILLL